MEQPMQMFGVMVFQNYFGGQFFLRADHPSFVSRANPPPLVHTITVFNATDGCTVPLRKAYHHHMVLF